MNQGGSTGQVWHFREEGTGRPLILLHGIGMSHAAWRAVIPYLRQTRRVIAFDIAGFGETAPLPRQTPPTIDSLVEAMRHSIRGIGIDEPIDIGGNSLGGCMALEAARVGLARSVVAISPCGLWKSGPPPHVRYVFQALRFTARKFPNILKAAVRRPWLRELALAVPVSVGSRRMPASDAVRAVDDLARSRVFEDTFEYTRAPFSGRNISVPVTVAFGNRDWIFPKGSRSRTGLPAHARWIDQPGWGHVPMWVDPAGVSQLILDATDGARSR